MFLCVFVLAVCRVFRGQVVRNEVSSGDNGGVQIFPFTAAALDVEMSSRGAWPFECGVADHVLAGLKGRLLVV
jgi:hypothetical protein